MRPQSFSEMAGHEINKKILKAILKKPELAPRCLIFEGERGTGKTTSSRIFAKSLNCLNLQSDFSPCNKCENCMQGLDFSNYYYEYNTSIVGNVESMKALRDTFSMTSGAVWKVITFDEIHLASKQAQSALLKDLEDVSTNLFFVFCTTESSKLIDTIHSRSLVLHFEKISNIDLDKNLRYIAGVKGITIDDECLSLLIKRSGGHVREAHILLDMLKLVGAEDFKHSIKLADIVFKNLFINLLKSKSEYFQTLNELLSFPIVHLKNDFQNVLLDLTSIYVGKYQGDSLSNNVLSLWGANWLKFVKMLMSDWVMDAFDSDVMLQVMFLSLYQIVNANKSVPNSSQNVSQSSTNSLMSRAMKQ